MSKSQEQMKELIEAIRSGQSDKETLCKAIQKDVNNLIYPVFGEDYKRISPRAIIDICMNLDSINVDKNIMRQIATRVSVYMFGLIDDSTIRIDDNLGARYEFLIRLWWILLVVNSVVLIVNINNRLEKRKGQLKLA
ncbi:MAG: hypothetical protein KIC66_04510 [Clostridium sp.]|uniref:hypothetical protein n=1 Tax=Clostridium sp. TaxID=1506 RepID=UPI0025B7D24D|nr:hypothetical protein [Clostridium sp.]MBS5926336.1 hypothetical protein [Clostridium sp.]